MTAQFIVAQIGARRHYAVPRALHHLGNLNLLITDACGNKAPWDWFRHVPRSWLPDGLQRVVGRSASPIPAKRIRQFSRFFLQRKMGRQRRAPGEPLADYWARRNNSFGELVTRSAWGNANAIYAYNGAAIEIFRLAKERGLRCVLDQTTAPWRYNTELLKREQVKWPGWEKSPGDIDDGGIMIAREEAEWDLADRIVCGSQFVVDSIRDVGGPVEKCRVVKYPTPPVPESEHSPVREEMESAPRHTRRRALFVGTLQLRKGIQYFCDAARSNAEDWEFRAIGPSALTPRGESKVRQSVDWRGAVPRAEVWQHYQWADVFLFPTLSEGSANVCHEAVAAGLPVLTTPAAGIADHPSITIFPLAAGAADALAGLEPSPENQAGAPSTRSWESYCDDLVAAL